MTGVTATESCPRCDRSVFAEDRYCSHCGQRLGMAGLLGRAARGGLALTARAGSEILRRPRARQLAGGAAIGAVAGAVVPFVSAGAGLVAGAAYAGYRIVTKEKPR